jgi:hypothetical protein
VPLDAGARLGPYEILAAIGAGGIGEVYRARDTRLDRTVAIKVLPPEVAGGPERRQRFAREARAIASLTHPHICTLHEFDTEDGTDFLVMEHLEGKPRWRWGMSLSMLQRKTPPARKPMAGGIQGIPPVASVRAMAGARSDQKEAAIITPAAKPSMPSRSLRLTVRKKKTQAAPAAVSSQVKRQAQKACSRTGSSAKASSMAVRLH